MGLVVGGWLFSVALVFARADEPNKFAPPADSKESVMRRKLTEAQRLLEGLALNDFNKIIIAVSFKGYANFYFISNMKSGALNIS